jgi:phosphate transport system substrate-binding protein
VKNSAAKRPEVARFLKYYVENLEQLAAKALYDPPTGEDKAANFETLNKLLPGGAGEVQSTAKVAD